jgi:hypothetical protein
LPFDNFRQQPLPKSPIEKKRIKIKVRVLIDGTELEGWEPRAAWDDFKLGLKHGNEFEKIAIYGNRKWQEIAVKVGSWLISGQVEFFETEDQAISWLNE